jgi:replicative DNA helicase
MVSWLAARSLSAPAVEVAGPRAPGGTLDRVDGKTPPNSLEAEMSVLGAILLDNDVYANLEGSISADHFYKEAHRKIFRAIERLHRRGDPMDLVMLTDELRTSGELDSVGSVNYLIGLADSVPTAAYADNYARVVIEKATLRELISASGRILQTAYDQAMPLSDVMDQAEQSIFDLTTKKRRTHFEGMRSLVTETFADINERFANPDPVSGLRTGFRELDQMTAGLQRSTLNVLAARPAMGKTAFAMTIALNTALKENAAIGVFNFEMSGIQLVTRMLCSEARVDMSRVRNGQLSDRDFQRLADTAGKLSEAKIFIDDTSDMTVMELRSRARRLMAEHDLGLLIIDYLQLMSGSSRSTSENRQQEISMISRGLKNLARELDIPILVLSQLSRAVEARPNKRPMLSDLRECVTADTLVDLVDGSSVPIVDLVGTRPHVLAVDEDGTVVTARSDKVWRVGPREVFAVTLANGAVRTTTAKHRWYSYDGWKRLEQLAPGDRVGVVVGSGQMAAPTSPPTRPFSMAATGPRSAATIVSAPAVSWHAIVSIEPAGVADVYDLTVPGPESWLSDGVVMHNSGAIEQDADLVMFIYRDEYYDQHSEKHGIAEIIIGKQRNGPTGNLELQFHNSHVRFNDLARQGG